MRRCLAVVLAILAGIMSGITYSHGSAAVISAPGYRPPSEGNSDKLFRERLGNIEITVFPTVVRSFGWTKYDELSRERIRTFLEKNNIAKTCHSDQKIDLSESTPRVQWDLFQKSMSLFVNHLKANPIETEYVLMVEFLVTPKRAGGEAIGGIQCYVLNSSGRNVFSFLLNSHHKLFTGGRLKINDVTDENRPELIRRGTKVVIEAFRRQLDLKNKKESKENE